MYRVAQPRSDLSIMPKHGRCETESFEAKKRPKKRAKKGVTPPHLKKYVAFMKVHKRAGKKAEVAAWWSLRQGH
jgi:hypothetical protein